MSREFPHGSTYDIKISQSVPLVALGSTPVLALDSTKYLDRLVQLVAHCCGCLSKQIWSKHFVWNSMYRVRFIVCHFEFFISRSILMAPMFLWRELFREHATRFIHISSLHLTCMYFKSFKRVGFIHLTFNQSGFGNNLFLGRRVVGSDVFNRSSFYLCK